ncbi:ROK family protein [Saccharibacillus sp. CPCC 101409]|uniref:ROK family protein n=1 Tax=Saccharibacillus sp. CPCC 101409 TaxID=3058041 RepID=UPI002672008D|nr:ROK family protein [Saccharibacillus sp. CPCC 101409]MDO3412519.1 ROK family protein [Saccharibacillus sp. CPCC 101409]
MSSSLIVAFDVGGTQIKAAAVVGGAVREDTIGYYESRADLAADDIIARFAGIFVDTLDKAGPDAAADGLGLAFPGPFDYEAGVSRIRGLGKFDALYGLAVGELLERELRANERTKARLAPRFRIVFENDAALFGLGESAAGGAAESARRAVCLTIGTGLGSCFLEQGRLVKHREDAPDEGWLYTVPYENGIADDYISRRGVLALAEELGLDARRLDVRELAGLAESGEEKARLLFERFGRRMALILTPSLLKFRPEVVVLGGQISKSAHLFAPAFEAEAAAAGLAANIEVSSDTLLGTLRGIYSRVNDTYGR